MIRNTFLFCVIIIFIGNLVYADLPPRVIKKFQEAAPEKLEIKVIDVKKETIESENSLREFIEITAQVIKVRESKNGLKPGDHILISYRITHKYIKGDPNGLKRIAPQIGPQRWSRILIKNKHYFAYLEARGTIEKGSNDPPLKPELTIEFAPAAYRGSFIDVEQKEQN